MYKDISGNPKYTDIKFLYFLTLIVTIFSIDPISEIQRKLFPELPDSGTHLTTKDNTPELKIVLSIYINLYNETKRYEYPDIDINFLNQIITANLCQYTNNKSSCSVMNKYYHHKYMKYKNKYDKLKIGK